jgi:hypothetical protein
MKQTLSLLFLLSLASMISCKKGHDHNDQPKFVTIDTTIANGQEYTLDLKQYGDDDDVATITKQGTQYSVSEVRNSGYGFSPVYHYIGGSIKDVSPDQVVLSVKEGGDRGGRCHHSGDSTCITINFKFQ